MIVEHSPSGALGLVINKPIGEQPLASVLKALGQEDGEVTGNLRIFSGGPVRREVGFVVHSPDYHRPETTAITGRLSITSSLAILQDIGDRKGRQSSSSPSATRAGGRTNSSMRSKSTTG